MRWFLNRVLLGVFGVILVKEKDLEHLLSDAEEVDNERGKYQPWIDRRKPYKVLLEEMHG